RRDTSIIKGETKVKPLQSAVRAFAATLTLGIAAVAWIETSRAWSDAPAVNSEVTVYATPTCGCCGAWMEHLRANGFTVNVVYQDDLTAIRQEHKVPAELTSCHLGVVDGFAVEGHVPAEVVVRLLKERPEVLGLAVPGMVTGSPGMEHPNG